MPRRQQPPKTLGSVLERLIDQLGIGSKLRDADAVAAWFDVAGPAASAVTERAWISGGRLYIKISSPTWRHELSLQRDEWRDRINDRVGSDVVREIVFR